MLKCLFIQIIVVYLQRVFHSIRFKVNRGAAAPHFCFIHPKYVIFNRLYMISWTYHNIVPPVPEVITGF